MNKLQNLSGGMPLQIGDFDFIHQAYLMGFVGLLSRYGGGALIISGLNLSGIGSQLIVSAGYYYNGAELFYVGGGTFTVVSGHHLYLVPNFSDTESRTYHDGVSRPSRQLRSFQLYYGDDPPETTGVVLHGDIARLQDIVNSKTLDVVTGGLHFGANMSVVYRTGYSGATGYNAVHVSNNGLGDVMIMAAFTCTSANGHVFTLPEGYRPVADVTGMFWANNSAGVLKIRKDGKVLVSGASTGGNNYISFRFTRLVTDLVGFNLPEGGGGATEGGGLAIPESMRIIHETGESTLLTISGELEIVEMMINRVPYSGIKGDTFNGMDYKVRVISGNTEITMNPQLDLKFVNGDIIDIKYTDAF